MSRSITTGLFLGAALVLVTGIACAEEEHREDRGPEHAQQHAMRPAEPHPGPSGYQRPAEPQGWNARPKTFDRPTYQHNFQAARSFRIGPYPHPRGWVDRRWNYGEFLPRAYWAAPYILADYWLFALEVPPVGFEWVRIGGDAALVNTGNGEILQMEYGVFN